LRLIGSIRGQQLASIDAGTDDGTALLASTAISAVMASRHVLDRPFGTTENNVLTGTINIPSCRSPTHCDLKNIHTNYDLNSL